MVFHQSSSPSPKDCMKMPLLGTLLGTNRRSSVLFVVANERPVGGQLDNENWNTVDLHEAARRPGLRRRHQPSAPQISRCTRNAMPCFRRGGKDWPPNQHRKDRGHEGEQQTNRATKSRSIKEIEKFVYLGSVVS